MNAPIGWLGSFSPTRLRCIAFTIFSMALSCATTLAFSSSAMRLSRAPSLSAIRCTGTPDVIETTSATASSVTMSRVSSLPSDHSLFCRSSSCSSFVCSSRQLMAISKFCFFTAMCFFSFISSICFCRRVIISGTSACCKWILEPTSSIASIALSGKARSVM